MSYQLHALRSYEYFRLALSCAPVPTEVVSHMSSIWSLELEMSFPAWIHLKSLFFSLQEYLLLNRKMTHCHVYSFSVLTDLQHYMCCTSIFQLWQSQSIWVGFFLNSSGNYLLLKKENHESLSKESKMLRKILQYCRGSNLLWCVQ